MKLIYLHQYFKKPTMNGGIRSYEFVKRLSLSGHDVIVVTSDTERCFKGWEIEKYEGFEIHWISVKYNNNFGFFHRIWAFFKFFLFSSIYVCKINSDKLFATSTPLTVAFPALCYKFFKKKPYIFEVRDVWPEVPIALGVIKNRLIIKVAKLIEKLAYKYADSIIALSPDMKTSICSVSPNSKVYVIPNASDIDSFVLEENETSNLCDEYEIIRNQHKKIVFYTGTLGLVNNVSYLVELSCFSKGDIAFVIVGEGREKEKIIKLAQDKGVLGKTFYMLPAVKRNQLKFIHDIFDMAASTVLPIKQLYSNSANKVFDAFASGTPILINHSGWIEDLIDNYKCGLALSETPSQIEYDKLANFLYSSDFVNSSEASSRLGKGEFYRESLFIKFKGVIENEESI
ncbi:glycosyltransferase family 4 protein [Vibrio alginolyticus]